MENRRKYKWPARVLKFLLCLFGFTLFQVAALKFINPPVTPNVAWAWMESVIKNKPEKRPVYRWKKMEQISPHLRRAVLASEDQRFPSHSGFDFSEIQNACNNFIREKKLRGASTISMQTARSVFLLSSRNIFRKLAEIYYTVLIELFWDKHRILEMYLNTVDWGTGVTGAEAAARKYFFKSALSLTRDEAALMTAILPNPHKWSVRNPSPHIILRKARIMKVMHMMPLL
ncbi:MAG: monofunctional biosynthetic peptidoglycan transglycosylase [Desulfobacterales bacterium RIFOXYA12_FULL_46_15]|nr:MAG: monofunctional biosynthetic peptidoglycan transglycosylase [Desulfobacula sp. GWF2_41_7]OGR27294.1 MAG: monofunctional biosynthetic peptidoglycan transglycosylase [Desulfobacterales bacterium RIFOXYA12_FULL_46_15]